MKSVQSTHLLPECGLVQHSGGRVFRGKVALNQLFRHGLVRELGEDVCAFHFRCALEQQGCTCRRLARLGCFDLTYLFFVLLLVLREVALDLGNLSMGKRPADTA